MWEVEGPKREAARKAQKIIQIEDVDKEDYNKKLTETIAQYSIPPAPAMPLRAIACASRDILNEMHSTSQHAASEAHSNM